MRILYARASHASHPRSEAGTASAANFRLPLNVRPGMGTLAHFF